METLKKNVIPITVYHLNLSKYLGTPFGPHSMTDQVTELVSVMVKRFNTMLSTFECCSYQVKYKLFKSYCTSLYGSVLCDLSSKQILRLYTTWKKCLRQLLKITHIAHGEYLPFIVEDFLIEGQLVKRFIQFYISVINSDNSILQFCGQLVTNGSNSAVCNSVMYVKSKYNLKYKCDNTLSIKELYTELGKYVESHSDNDIENIVAIRDLLFLRDGPSCLTYEEFNILIDYFFMLNSL